MDDIRTRKFTLKKIGPATLDEENRSVEVVIANQSDKVRIYDWDLGDVPEILIMSGCRVPDSGQVPLMDTHNRWSVNEILGSVRDIKVKAGAELVGRAVYSKSDAGEQAFMKTKEGHLTDFSAGFRIMKQMKLTDTDELEIEGNTYSGPAVIVTDWELKEVSACPIGADPDAKARSEKQQKEKAMKNEKKEEKILTDNQDDTAPSDAGEKKPDVDLDKIREETRAMEQERIISISSMCQRHGCDDLIQKLIEDGSSIDAARAAVLETIEARHQKKDMPEFAADVTMDEKDKFRAAALDGLRLRCGHTLERVAPGAMDFRGFSLRELARECLRRRGERIPSNMVQMVSRALSTDDLPYLLGEVANRSLLEGWESAGETWQTWCATGNVPDFNERTLLRASEFGDLDEIPEGGEYKHATIDEARETVKVVKFGKMFPITYEAIVNDELDVISEVPMKMGEAAARKIGDLPYTVLVANSAMGDGVALFHGDHGNLASSGAAVDVDTLDAAYAAMGLQKDIKGKRRLNIRPMFFIGPVSKMGSNERFFRTEDVNDPSGNVIQTNIYSGNVLTRVYEARLDDDSITSWYLAARRGMTVKVFFLNGNQRPYMENRNGWTVDGTEYKVRIEGAAKAVDYKGLYKNPGA